MLAIVLAIDICLTILVGVYIYVLIKSGVQASEKYRKISQWVGIPLAFTLMFYSLYAFYVAARYGNNDSATLFLWSFTSGPYIGMLLSIIERAKYTLEKQEVQKAKNNYGGGI